MSMSGMPELSGSPDSRISPSNLQQLFIYYFTATLTDLVVLGLFDEYSHNVHIDGFTVLLLAAVALQILLKMTIAVERRWSRYCSHKVGSHWSYIRFLGAWFIMFVSKFVILESMSIMFADKVKFEGPLDGLVWLLLVVTAMLAAEELLLRLYRKLADPGFGPRDFGMEDR